MKTTVDQWVRIRMFLDRRTEGPPYTWFLSYCIRNATLGMLCSHEIEIDLDTTEQAQVDRALADMAAYDANKEATR